MAKIHFIRHAQSLANADAAQYVEGSDEWMAVYESQDHFNTRLSAYGEEQAATQLTDSLRGVDNVDVVFVSTLNRTLQSAHLGLQKFQAGDSGTKWIATDTIREWLRIPDHHHPCNHRDEASLEQARKEFPYIDFQGVTSHDPIPVMEDVHSLDARVQQFVKLLHANVNGGVTTEMNTTQRKAGDVVVVAHNNFLRRLYLRVFAQELSFHNCEVRSESLVRLFNEAIEKGFQLE